MPIKSEGKDATRSRLWWKRGKSGNAAEISYVEGMSARQRYRYVLLAILARGTMAVDAYLLLV